MLWYYWELWISANVRFFLRKYSISINFLPGLIFLPVKRYVFKFLKKIKSLFAINTEIQCLNRPCDKNLTTTKKSKTNLNIKMMYNWFFGMFLKIANILFLKLRYVFVGLFLLRVPPPTWYTFDCGILAIFQLLFDNLQQRSISSICEKNRVETTQLFEQVISKK